MGCSYSKKSIPLEQCYGLAVDAVSASPSAIRFQFAHNNGTLTVKPLYISGGMISAIYGEHPILDNDEWEFEKTDSNGEPLMKPMFAPGSWKWDKHHDVFIDLMRGRVLEAVETYSNKRTSRICHLRFSSVMSAIPQINPYITWGQKSEGGIGFVRDRPICLGIACSYPPRKKDLTLRSKKLYIIKYKRPV
mmetsp:Transcript_17167/g.22302  ORF Transcript_17167/g.22302 Transcript_17167/m.22302 type:complete len:191 (+) Transcript_17167:1744-2316(+)